MSTVVVLVFLGTTAYTLGLLSAIRRDTSGLHSNAIPSARRLIDARSTLTQMEGTLERTANEGAASIAELARERSLLQSNLEAYRTEPLYPGEAQLDRRVSRVLDTFDAQLRQAGRQEIRAPDRRALRESLYATDLALSQLVRFNLDHAESHAYHIESIWETALKAQLLLSVGCVLLTLSITLIAARSLHKRDAFLAERSQELEQFAARMAHDVLGPLSTVTVAMPVLARRASGDPTALKMADRASASIARVKVLVHDLLAFALAGARTDPNAGCDVAEVVGGVLRELGPEAEEGKVELSAAPSESHWTACSAGVLASALANLVRNAIKFTRECPVRKVTVRLVPHGRRLRFEVADTGPGLSPEMQQRVFQAYFQAERGKPGIGLGLATVKRLVEAHGGEVGVASTPGAGALFWFELPAKAPPQKTEPPPPSARA